jgi:alanyl-tRNA synthetase
MGLERITAVLQGVLSNYDTDLFTPILTAIGEIGGTTYGGTMSPTDVSMRVIADHARAATFCIADGVVPSTKSRGYELRRIMRRAMRHGKRLGINEPFFHRLVDVLVREMGEAYPELGAHRDYAVRLIRAEEERFESVLTSGLPRLEEALDRATAGDNVLGGEEAFRLYETYGVPRDFIEDMAGQRQVKFDTAGFLQAMEAQKKKARAGSAFGVATAGAGAFDAATEGLLGVGDLFEGYTTTRVEGAVVLAALDEDGQPVDALAEGQSGYVALDRTPFYVESGGQVSDTGRLIGETAEFRARVEGLVRAGADRLRLHRIRIETGELQPRDVVVAEVDEDARDATRRNHTATHLLHAALRQVLGAHVKQGGSLVSPDRLRFDFAHDTALTPEQLDRVELIVNEQILRNTTVQTEVKSTDEAIAAGAMALFGEKYGSSVRVVSVPGFSMELCGGTHVRATGDIGLFSIVQETGVAAGVRRIEAATGLNAVRLHQEQRRSLAILLDAVKAPADQAVATIERLQTDSRRLARENSDLKLKVAMGGGPSGPNGDDGVDAGGVRLLTRRVIGLDKNGLGQLADALRNTLQSGVVVVASENEGRVAMVVSVTKNLTPAIHAGNIVKKIAPIVGGGGGGRPDFAEAGGKNPAGIDQMLTEARAVVAGMAAKK